MTTVAPQWPYLVQIDGTIQLASPGDFSTEQSLGDYCGEWGSYLDEHGKPAGVRLMFFLDNVPQNSEFLRAVNTTERRGDFVVLFHDSRLADADGCPFLPVYRATRPDGREILQLSGYE
jgi:hypothetical protein